MGIETILLASSLAVGAANVVVQRNAAKKAAAARREENAISGASQEVQNRLARRRAAMETRLRRARIAQSSATSGVLGSSGQLGAESALASSFGTSVAQQDSEVLASRGITEQRQIGANALQKADTFNAFASLYSSAVKTGVKEGWFS